MGGILRPSISENQKLSPGIVMKGTENCWRLFLGYVHGDVQVLSREGHHGVRRHEGLRPLESDSLSKILMEETF